MSWILTVLLMVFMFCCGVAIVSFPWILMGRNTSYHIHRCFATPCIAAEWFSPELKSVVQTASISFSFLMIFVAVQSSSLILAQLGTGGLFLYFCGVCGAMTLFIAMFVPETRGQMYQYQQK